MPFVFFIAGLHAYAALNSSPLKQPVSGCPEIVLNTQNFDANIETTKSLGCKITLLPIKSHQAKTSTAPFSITPPTLRISRLPASQLITSGFIADLKPYRSIEFSRILDKIKNISPSRKTTNLFRIYPENPSIIFTANDRNAYKLTIKNDFARNHAYWFHSLLNSSIYVSIINTYKDVGIQDASCNTRSYRCPIILEIEPEITKSDPLSGKYRSDFWDNLFSFRTLPLFASDLQQKTHLNGDIQFIMPFSFPNPQQLRRHVAKLDQKLSTSSYIVAPPWVGYDNLSRRGSIVTPAEYRTLLNNITSQIRDVNGRANILSAFPSNLIGVNSASISYPSTQITLPKGFSYVENMRLSKSIISSLKKLGIPESSVIKHDTGAVIAENWISTIKEFHSDQPSEINDDQEYHFAVAVKSNTKAVTNYLLGSIQATIEKLPYRGAYIDQFSVAFAHDNLQRFSYEHENGKSKSILDTALDYGKHRLALLRKLQQLKIPIVLNTKSNSADEDQLNIPRFSETFWDFQWLFSRSPLAAASRASSPLSFAGHSAWQGNFTNYPFDFSYFSLRHGLLPVSINPSGSEDLISKYFYPVTHYATFPTIVVSQDRLIALGPTHTLSLLRHHQRFSRILGQCRGEPKVKQYQSSLPQVLALINDIHRTCIYVAFTRPKN